MSAEQGDVKVIREALDELCLNCAESPAHDRIRAALDRLAAALERAERERDLEWFELKHRAEKAERALAEIIEEFRSGSGGYNENDPVVVIARAALARDPEWSVQDGC